MLIILAIGAQCWPIAEQACAISAYSVIYNARYLTFVNGEEFGFIPYLLAIIAFSLPVLSSQLLAMALAKRRAFLYALVPSVCFCIVERVLCLLGTGIELIRPRPCFIYVTEPLFLTAALLLSRHARRLAALPVALAFALNGSLLGGPSDAKVLKQSFKLAVVQTEFRSALYLSREGSLTVSQSILRSARACLNQEINLVIYPEQVAPDPGLGYEEEFTESIKRLSSNNGPSILMGTTAWSERGEPLNASRLVEDGRLSEAYVKKKLVLGSEWAPSFMRFLLPQNSGKFDSAGINRDFVLRSGVTVQSKICFEILDPLTTIPSDTIVALQGSTAFDSSGRVNQVLLDAARDQSRAHHCVVAASFNCGASAIYRNGHNLAVTPKGGAETLVVKFPDL